MSRATQCERLLNLLKSHEGQKVTLPRILDLRIANYRARLTELRRELWPQNYEIILFDERVGRERHTAYMLRRIQPQHTLECKSNIGMGTLPCNCQLQQAQLTVNDGFFAETDKRVQP